MQMALRPIKSLVENINGMIDDKKIEFTENDS